MPLQLPKPIEVYLASENTDDLDALAACFTADAVVRDEKRTMKGLANIREWKAASKKNYRHTVELIDAAHKDGKTIAKVKVSGNFPGSPITLQYVFSLAGDKIASLEIG